MHQDVGIGSKSVHITTSRVTGSLLQALVAQEEC